MSQAAKIFLNPISRFYRRDELAWGFIMDQKLLQPVELKSAHEFMIGMDRENIWQSANQETPRQYLERRFGLDKSDANKILKKLRTLGIIADVSNTRNALRINPWLANKSKFLSGYWEFEEVKLTGLVAAGYDNWLAGKGLMCVGTLSYQRTKVSSNRKEIPEKKIERLEKHIEELIQQLDSLVDEHTKDTENFLRDQREKDMLIQTMQKQHEETMQAFTEMKVKMDHTNRMLEFLMGRAKSEDVQAVKTMFTVHEGGKSTKSVVPSI